MKKIIPFFLILIFISCNRSSSNDQAGEKPPLTAGLKIETPAEANKRKRIPKELSDFMINASIEKMYTIELHKHALATLQESGLKTITGNALETDTLLLGEFTRLAEKKNITLPIVMDKSHQRLYEKWVAIKDQEECKKEYVSLFLKSTETIENLFEKGSEKISDADIKSCINKNLSAIRQQKIRLGRINAQLNNPEAV